MTRRIATIQKPAHAPRSRRTRRSISTIVAVVGAAVGVRIAGAEPDPPQGQQRTEMLAAHAVARVALEDLKDVGNPTARDYRIAEELLATAANLLPNDQTILRLYMEAAAAANDTQTMRDIARRLVKLDPDDTVSLLRVVSAKISELQTADERLAAYDQFVGGEGAESFDKSVRSRLALDAALLAREKGDLAGFRDRLSTSIGLDPTNRDAATLGLAFYTANAAPGDVTGRLDFMFQVLWTDPFDPSIYSSIVSELVGGGASKQALRFAKLQRRIYGIQGKPMPEADEAAYDLAEWTTVGPEAVIRRISDDVEKSRQRVIEQRKKAQEQGVPMDAFTRPEDVRLPIGRERSRIICAAAMLDRERAALFLNDLATSIATLTRDAADPVRRDRALTEEAAVARARQANLDMAFLRLLSGLQSDLAAKTIDEAGLTGGIDAATLARLDAWLMLRTGDRELAEKTLGELGTTDPVAALGHALAAELRGDPNTAMVRYQAIAQSQTGNIAGAFAATRYTTLTGDHLAPGEAARLLDADAAAVPQSLDGMVDNPRRVMSLEVKALRPDVSPLERTPVRVTLRNTSWIALAMGPDKPICTRLLFAPAIDTGAELMPTADLVWVANMDRRLRLLPNESVDMIVWPDLGPLSYEMEQWLPKQATIRWRVLQGFELSEQRLYDAAPQMLSTDVDRLVRKLPDRADAVIQSLQYALQTGGPREIADVILSMKYQMVFNREGENALDLTRSDQLVEVLARRAANGSIQRAGKILALCLLPTQKVLGVAQRLDQVAAQDADEDVLAVALVARAGKADDPLFSAPGVLKSPRLTALAQLVKERLESGVTTYATSQWIVRSMVSTAPKPPAAPETTSSAPLTPPTDPAGSSGGDAKPPARVILPTIPPDPNPVPIVQ